MMMMTMMMMTPAPCVGIQRRGCQGSRQGAPEWGSSWRPGRRTWCRPPHGSAACTCQHPHDSHQQSQAKFQTFATYCNSGFLLTLRKTTNSGLFTNCIMLWFLCFPFMHTSAFSLIQPLGRFSLVVVMFVRLYDVPSPCNYFEASHLPTPVQASDDTAYIYLVLSNI